MGNPRISVFHIIIRKKVGPAEGLSCVKKNFYFILFNSVASSIDYSLIELQIKNLPTYLPIKNSASFGKYRFEPFQISFSVGFISRSCFESDGFIAYSNECTIFLPN